MRNTIVPAMISPMRMVMAMRFAFADSMRFPSLIIRYSTLRVGRSSRLRRRAGVAFVEVGPAEEFGDLEVLSPGFFGFRLLVEVLALSAEDLRVGFARRRGRIDQRLAENPAVHRLGRFDSHDVSQCRRDIRIARWKVIDKSLAEMRPG